MFKIQCDLCGSTIQGRMSEGFQCGILDNIATEIDLGHVVIRYSAIHRNDKGELKSKSDICPNCIRLAFGAADEAAKVSAATDG